MVKFAELFVMSFVINLSVLVYADDGIIVTDIKHTFEDILLAWQSNCKTQVTIYRIYYETFVRDHYFNNAYTNTTSKSFRIGRDLNFDSSYFFEITDSDSNQDCKSKEFSIETPINAMVSPFNVAFDTTEIHFDCPNATSYRMRYCANKHCKLRENNITSTTIHATDLMPNIDNRIVIEFYNNGNFTCIGKGFTVNTTIAKITEIKSKISITATVKLDIRWTSEYSATEYSIQLFEDNAIYLNFSSITKLTYSTYLSKYSPNSTYTIVIKGLYQNMLVSEGKEDIKDVELIEPTIRAADVNMCWDGKISIVYNIDNLSDIIENFFYLLVFSNVSDSEKIDEKHFLPENVQNLNVDSEWIAKEAKITTQKRTVSITIGDGSNITTKFGHFTNHPLQLDKQYHIVALVHLISGKHTKYSKPQQLTAKCLKINQPTEHTFITSPVNPTEDEDHPIILTVSLILLATVIIIAGAAFYFYRNKMSTLSKFGELVPILKRNATPDVSNNFAIGDLDQFLRNQNCGQIIDEEYKRIPIRQFPVDGQHFHRKNRYENALTIRKTRVYLERKDDLASQYINANYVTYTENSRPYIATQGPTKKTLGDFWRMMWEQRADTIVMLTNLKEKGVDKCDKYWPDVETSETYNEFTVYCEKIYTYSEYECRFLVLNLHNTKREIMQFHYTRWLDHDLPIVPHALVNFVRKVKESSSAPVVVHCSAGIGRTGSFILCNLVALLGKETGFVDIPKMLYKIRECRLYALNEKDQYKLCYCVVNELLNGRDTSMSLETFSTLNLDKVISADYYYANHTDYWLDVFGRTVHPDFKTNLKKNRNPIPYKSCRTPIFLQRNMDDDYCDYINAVNVDGNFICTQQPLGNTIGDFWRMVVEKKPSIILSLHGIDSKNTSSVVFWPTNLHVPLAPVSFLSINLVSTAEEDAFDLILLRISNVQTEEVNYVHFLNFKKWHHDSLPREADFLKCYDTYLKIVKPGNVILTCIDGAVGCGMFLTYVKIMEQINRNTEFDPCAVIRSLRYSRDDFMRKFDSFKYIYNIIQTNIRYISNNYEDIVTYSNI